MAATRHSTTDYAQQTYAKAVSLFKSRYTDDDRKRRWLDGMNSLEEVEAAVAAARSQYEARPRSKAKLYLSRFAKRIMFYSNIGDALVQQLPEYVSLAWGTMKLVFVLVTNHEELVSELAKSLARIADVLPRIGVSFGLYPTDEIRAKVEELYALIIAFHWRALKWYEASSLMHAVKAIIRPYKLEFEDILEQLHYCARSIESIANTASHKEIREIYGVIKDCLEEQKHSRRGQDRLTTKLQGFEETHGQTLQLLLETHQLLICILLTTQQNTTDTQVALMIAATKSSSAFVTPVESLRKCQIRCRKLRKSAVDVDDVWKSFAVKNWSLASDSSLLIVIGSSHLKLETLAVGTYMVELTKMADVPIMWALKSTATSSVEGSIPEVLRHLAMQALQLNHSTVGTNLSARFNAARVASAKTADEWLEVLELAMIGLPLVFVVIDSEILGSGARQEAELSAWLSLLQTIIMKRTNTIMKIAVLSCRKPTVSAALRGRRQQPRIHELYLDKLRHDNTSGVMAHVGRAAMRGRHAVAFRQGLRRRGAVAVKEEVTCA